MRYHNSSMHLYTIVDSVLYVTYCQTLCFICKANSPCASYYSKAAAV